MTDYTELKKAAEAATPGPWEWPNKGSSDFVISGADRLAIGHLDSPRTAEYVALANPATILALLAEREGQEQRIAELEAENTNLKYRLGVVIETAKQGSEHRAELQQQRDELQARWDGIQHLIKANGAGSVAQLAAQRDELIAASDEAVSEMKATAWDEEGYLLDPDLDDAANSLRATIAKVKP